MNLYTFDKFKIKIMLRKELKKNLVKFFLSLNYDILKSNKIMQIAYKNLYFYKYSSTSFYRTSCLVTGCCRAVNRTFKLSRYTIRLYASTGIITGLRKASF